MNGESALVGLLYRADWTRLRLSAVMSDASAVLIAPGKRYRYQAADYVFGCDGDRRWMLAADEDDGADGRVRRLAESEPPLPRLLCPAWLLERSRLQVRGHARACGRAAIDVVMSRRPGIRGRNVVAAGLSRPVEVLVDAESGMLLRVAEWADDGQLEVTEMVSVDFDPVVDPAQFMPPPGSRVAESHGGGVGGGLAWWAVKTAGGLAAGGLGAWIRYSPFRHTPPPAAATDAEAAIPADEPAPELSPDGVPAGPHVDDDLLALLHRGGPGELTATLHEWTDLAAMASSVPPAARQAGFGGLGLLMDALSELPATLHLTSTVRIAGPGRYQIDHLTAPQQGPVTVGCDGRCYWQVFSDKVTTCPAEALPTDIANLADPSWLLQCRLAGGAQITAGGRPAHRITAARGPIGRAPMLFPAAVASFDAEMGVVVRLTYYLGGKPVERYELRDVTQGTGHGDFQVNIPPGLPVVEVAGPFDGWRLPHPPHPASTLLNAANVAARQAAAEAVRTAMNFLRRADPRRPDDTS